MATRTFLNSEEAARAIALLQTEGAAATSAWLGDCLEKKLAQHKNWRAVRPYRLGSWARGELCAKSDIDLLFAGDETRVAELVRDFQAEGIKIRSRLPADASDWTVGVEAFDVLALLDAKPFFSEDEADLLAQRTIIQKRGASYRKKLFRTMRTERKERAQRYDSIANYLEPNLKYGPGGLRDLEQGLMIHDLFAEKFSELSAAGLERSSDVESVIAKLLKHKELLLGIRHFLHLHGGGDILIGSLQKETAEFFGLKSAQAFMSRLEASVAEVSFYADWIVEVAVTPIRTPVATAKSRGSSSAGAEGALKSERRSSASVWAWRDLVDILKMFRRDSGLLNQKRVRDLQMEIKPTAAAGRAFAKFFNAEMSDEFLQALFRSGVMARLVPSLERLRGHVQHDQYHRFSVDAHTLQAVREVLRIKREPKRLGPLAKVARELSAGDWNILVWAALYHDLGKGLKGDHSTEGAEIVTRDLTAFGHSGVLIDSVRWLVQNHLLLSSAAFRQNIHSPSTWAELFRRGVQGRALLQLAIFTAADIRATNPEAWTEWKARLLNDLVGVLVSPKAGRLSELLTYAQKKKLKLDREFVEKLDPRVVESVPREAVLKDFQMLKRSGGDLPPVVLRNRRRETWVRFHSREDKSGLFVSFVAGLHKIGLGVQEAYIQTYPNFGAYDWFKIKAKASSAIVQTQLRKIFSSETEASTIAIADKTVLAVRFAVIEIVSQDDVCAVISFRGKDQRGALFAAALALYKAGFEILSAQVHTWGRQIDDVFTVKKIDGLEEAVRALGEKLRGS